MDEEKRTDIGLLILGLKTRLVTPFVGAVALGAGAVHFENGWNYTSKPDGGAEYQ